MVGLWHGAGWNFIVWGAYHAALILGYHALRGPWDRLPGVAQITLTFTLVSLGWPLFKYSLPQCLELWAALFAPDDAAVAFSAGQWLYLGVIAALTFLVNEKERIYAVRERRLIDSPVVHAAMLVAAVVFFPFAKTFIYFQF